MKTFSFLVHPRDAEDLARVERNVSRAEFARISAHWCAFEYEPLRFDGARGRLVALPFTAAQMELLPRSFVRAKVLEAADLASRLGADVIGLGAMTSVVTRAGSWLSGRVPAIVSNGNAYTAAVVAEQVSGFFGESLSSLRVAIVGGAGSVGFGCAKLLAPACNSLLLIGRFRPSLERARRELGATADVEISTRLETLRSADVVVLATSASEPVLYSCDLREGATVFDVTEPCNVSSECLVEARTRQIHVLRSGLVRALGLDLHRVDATLRADRIYACLAEALLFALEDCFDADSVGIPSVDRMRELAQAAGRWGLVPQLEPRVAAPGGALA